MKQVVGVGRLFFVELAGLKVKMVREVKERDEGGGSVSTEIEPVLWVLQVR